MLRKEIMMIAVAFLIITCFFSALYLRVYAEQNDGSVSVGVKVGDWVKYDFTHVNELSYWENDWTKVEVENVSGTSVLIHVSTEYVNRYPHDHMDLAELTLNVDVNGNLIEAHNRSPCDLVSSYMPYVIAGNLSVGDYAVNDLVDKLSNDTPTFVTNHLLNQEIVVRQYGEAAREVVLVNESVDQSIAGDPVRVSAEYCWDRSTGLLLEYAITVTHPGNPTYYIAAMFMRVVDTNLWKMPQPPPPWDQIALGMALPSAAIILIVTVKERKAIHRKVQE